VLVQNFFGRVYFTPKQKLITNFYIMCTGKAFGSNSCYFVKPCQCVLITGGLDCYSCTNAKAICQCTTIETCPDDGSVSMAKFYLGHLFSSVTAQLVLFHKLRDNFLVLKQAILYNYSNEDILCYIAN